MVMNEASQRLCEVNVRGGGGGAKEGHKKMPTLKSP